KQAGLTTRASFDHGVGELIERSSCRSSHLALPGCASSSDRTCDQDSARGIIFPTVGSPRMLECRAAGGGIRVEGGEYRGVVQGPAARIPTPTSGPAHARALR